jgi:hypothetical protein
MSHGLPVPPLSASPLPTFIQCQDLLQIVARRDVGLGVDLGRRAGLLRGRSACGLGGEARGQLEGGGARG